MCVCNRDSSDLLPNHGKTLNILPIYSPYGFACYKTGLLYTYYVNVQVMLHDDVVYIVIFPTQLH